MALKKAFGLSLFRRVDSLLWAALSPLGEGQKSQVGSFALHKLASYPEISLPNWIFESKSIPLLSWNLLFTQVHRANSDGTHDTAVRRTIPPCKASGGLGGLNTRTQQN